MMALAEALNDMRRYAARGRVGDGARAVPRLHLSVTGKVTRGEVAVVTWWATRARETKIIVMSPGFPPIELRVPARGRRPLPNLPVGRHTILLRVRPMGARGDDLVVEEAAVVEVVYPRPVIDIIAPHRVVLGQVLRVFWNIQDAQHVEINAPDGQRPAEFQDTFEIQPAECGAVQIRLRAVGLGGETEQRLFIDVVAPPVVIDVPELIRAEAGEDIVIRYAVSGAAVVTLSAPDRDDRVHAIPYSGRIEVDAVTESERFLLVATGHDGRAHSRSIAVTLVPMADQPIDDFLEILNGRR